MYGVRISPFTFLVVVVFVNRPSINFRNMIDRSLYKTQNRFLSFRRMILLSTLTFARKVLYFDLLLPSGGCP